MTIYTNSKENNTQCSRLDYIDALRGVMIIMVIYFHLLVRGIFINVDYLPSAFAEVLQRVRMPLFFCITGFLAYGNYDLSLFKKRFSNRIKKQLVPTLVVFVFYMAITKESLIQGLYEGIIDDAKGGYWFTYSLVQVWSIYAIISLIFHNYQINEMFQLLCFSLFVIVLLPLKYIIPIYCPSFLETNISNILSLNHDIALMPFFFLGIVIRIVYPMIDKFMGMAMSKSKAIYAGGVSSCLSAYC